MLCFTILFHILCLLILHWIWSPGVITAAWSTFISPILEKWVGGALWPSLSIHTHPFTWGIKSRWWTSKDDVPLPASSPSMPYLCIFCLQVPFAGLFLVSEARHLWGIRKQVVLIYPSYIFFFPAVGCLVMEHFIQRLHSAQITSSPTYMFLIFYIW